MESSQLYAATLTHCSTGPLTTGPDYDPLLLLLALAGDVHPNPGPSRCPCSVCFGGVTSQGTSYLCTRCSHWVHSRCSGLRNAADYRKANGWICTACMTPPRPRTPSPPPSPAHMPTMSDKTFNILQWNANGIGNKQTELSIFLEAHNVKVAAIQESKLTAKSRSPNIQNYTLVRHDRRQGPGVEITELEHKVNTYLTEMSRFLQENSLLISAPKSSVTLFTPDPAQANTRPKIKIADSEIPLVRSPKLLGVYLDTFFSFNKHCVQVANRVSKRNNVLKALAGTNWGQQKETLLMTYKALGRSIANYAAPVWSINASETNIGKIQRAQNEALRIITGSHKMSSIDHIHSETKMLQVEDHLNLLSAQYLVQCLDTGNVCHHITKMDLPPREMKETIFTRHYQTVLPLLANNRKDTLQALHTSFVNTAIGNMKDNRVLNSRPPSINDEETLLQRRQRTTLSQLRSGHCKLLNSYKKRLKQSDSSRCPDCGMDPQDVPHLFDCVAHPNDLSPVNLWDKPIETIRELSFLDPGNLN